jgi:hypothetical protein
MYSMDGCALARYAIAAGASVGTIALVLLGSSPFRDLLSAFGPPVTLHAGAALGLILVAAFSLPLGWRLLGGAADAVPPLRVLATLEALLALLAVAFGNWLFIRSSYGGILQYAGPAQRTLFEFKRQVALFPFPLATAAAFILWRDGARVPADRQLRTLVALLLGLGFFSLVMAFGLGAAVTRLRTM